MNNYELILMENRSIIKYILYLFLIGSTLFLFDILTLIFICLSLVLHEFGHIISRLIFGQDIHNVRISFFGKSYVKSESSDTKFQRIINVTSGIWFGLATLSIALLTHNYIIILEHLDIIYIGVLTLSLLSLFPIKGYDGYILFQSISKCESKFEALKLIICSYLLILLTIVVYLLILITFI